MQYYADWNPNSMVWIKSAVVLCSLSWIANGFEEQPIGVSVEELFDLIRSYKVTLIDVRMPWELAVNGKIAASINIPLNDVKAALSLSPERFQKEFGKRKPAKDDCNLVFHCRSGKRSFKALKIARDMGWTCARHLVGGFKAWREYFY